MNEPISLLDLTFDRLAALLADWGEPRYRAAQLQGWLYQRLVTDPAQMTDLPQALRARLAAETRLDPLELVYEQRSGDRQTYKWLFRLPAESRTGGNDQTIETVLMLYGAVAEPGVVSAQYSGVSGSGYSRSTPSGHARQPAALRLRSELALSVTKGQAWEPPPLIEKIPGGQRRTVCISTQVGCAMGCAFCATGQAGLARNLTAGEIVAQVLAAARWLAAPPAEADLPPGRLTNVVVMGMGEPLANYDHTWQALRTLTAPAGFNLGARHITLSTVGLVPGIRRMAGEPLQINLAVSLHAPNDALRAQLVPISRRYPLSEVMTAVRDYVGRTNRRVTFEYALMDGINDTPALARELARLLHGLLCHVNLIPLNPVAESPYQPSSPARAAAFLAVLEKAGIPATMRTRRGLDIDAGCGQLRRRVARETRR